VKRRFDFRLARLLRVRAIEERVARAEWSEYETAAQAHERRRAERADQLERSRAELAQRIAPGSTVRPEWMLVAESALDGQVRDLLHAHEDTLTRRAQADAMGTVWRERERDRRVLAELEGRSRHRHREELERWENQQLDEQALLRRSAALAANRRRPEEDSSSTAAPADQP